MREESVEVERRVEMEAARGSGRQDRDVMPAS